MISVINMTRILADLPDEDIDRLDALGASQKRSRASLLREAIRLFLAQATDDRSWIDRGYGLWADREDIPAWNISVRCVKIARHMKISD